MSSLIPLPGSRNSFHMDDSSRPDVHPTPMFNNDTKLPLQQRRQFLDLEKNMDSNSHFEITVDQLGELHDPKSLRKLHELGGYRHLVSDLNTDSNNGLPVHIPDFEERESHYGVNSLPQKMPKSFLRLCFEAMKDKTLIILSVAAIVSLALGLYETFGQPTEYDSEGKAEPKVQWVEGVAIIVAIAIVVLVGAANDFNKERQFVKLNAKKEDRQIIVYRSGEKHFVSINDLLVGDLIYVETGDIVPADSILVQGMCECDESSLTGETDTIKKVAAKLAEDEFVNSLHQDETLAKDEQFDIGLSKKVLDPMLISGSKLLSGQGKAIVTAVGVNSMHGKIMVSLSHEPEVTPLQARLDNLADGISKYGIMIAVLLFFVLFFKFCADLTGRYHHIQASEKGSKFMNILITSITIVVVAIPEGLPLAVTLALAFATTRMTKDGNLVRVLKSCETMGGATAVCSDKTGTLTENRMKVVKGSLGDLKFDDTADATSTSHERSVAVIDKLDKELINSIVTNILLNSTAFENRQDEQEAATIEILKKKSERAWWKKICNKTPAGKAITTASNTLIESTLSRMNSHIPTNLGDVEPFVGSKTECALLLLAQSKFQAIDRPLEVIRNEAKQSIVQVIPFESSRKWGGLVLKTDKGYRFYIKGASELVFSRCSYHRSSNGSISPISNNVQSEINDYITELADDALRTLSLAHRDFKGLTSWPPKDIQSNQDPSLADVDKLFGEPVLLTETINAGSSPTSPKAPIVPNIVISNDIEGLVLDCLVGIQDPLRAGVKDAIIQCQKAGVRVRMVTGDNILTARAISKNCGILTPDVLHNQYSSMEGPQFRKLSQEERFKIVPELCVLARSSPDDKRILVDTLRQLGEVVAVTGDGTNDAPALKLADVGFSMGIAGTEVAREASDIILMTDDFTSIVNAIKWGRTVSTSVRKFVQFQLTVNVTAVVLTFVSSVADADNGSVLTAVQLLWVNLIMDTLAALALATDKPDDDVNLVCN
ncbi:unnamed protein product [Ambrosiozyma monospora]|uniref:Calcium-transporting ATPase 2 n=1 Tax=Ambrosiozyma monospora TaxID=43982 RepID=A0A9W7DFZ3_AMBMO|nr:unnamed protein product [Ambrosiozyma monospora]